MPICQDPSSIGLADDGLYVIGHLLPLHADAHCKSVQTASLLEVPSIDHSLPLTMMLAARVDHALEGEDHGRPLLGPGSEHADQQSVADDVFPRGQQHHVLLCLLSSKAFGVDVVVLKVALLLRAIGSPGLLNDRKVPT